MALPKLNLQFLTFHDYLLRNYDLYRLESAYQIRMDIEDAVRRMDPRKEVKFLRHFSECSLNESGRTFIEWKIREREDCLWRLVQDGISSTRLQHHQRG